MVKVVKFGGSSLASAEQFAKVGDIIRADESRKYVVPSAPGKRNSRDTKVTDMLYACYAKAEAGEEFRVPLMKIKERYDSIPQWYLLHEFYWNRYHDGIFPMNFNYIEPILYL